MWRTPSTIHLLALAPSLATPAPCTYWPDRDHGGDVLARRLIKGSHHVARKHPDPFQKA
jgi:hypothetical protein